MILSDVIGSVQKIAPKLNASQVISILKLVCKGAETVCPAINGLMKPYRVFSPRATGVGLLPHQVARAYNFPAVPQDQVARRQVAIVELGGAYNQADVFYYCGKQGYLRPKLTDYVLPGATETSGGADGEVCLDIDVIAGAAQGCHIHVIFAPNTEEGFAAGVAKAVDLDVDAISISWGAPEDQWSDAGREALDAQFKRAVEKGIGIYCASGDNGSGDGETFGNHVDYPASSPWVVACGGTKLTLTSTGLRDTETAWTPGLFGQGGASGGGTSVKYNDRQVPDVSGNADPTTGYIIDIDGQQQQVGGTSAVAPLYAALHLLFNAKLNKHVGHLPHWFYDHPDAFFDVVSGNNGGYHAALGYDNVTGIGVIDGAAFLKEIGG